MLVWNSQDNHWLPYEWRTVVALDAGFLLEARVGVTKQPCVRFRSIVLTKSNDTAWNTCVTDEAERPDYILDGWKTVFLVYFRSLKDTSQFPTPVFSSSIMLAGTELYSWGSVLPILGTQHICMLCEAECSLNLSAFLSAMCLGSSEERELRMLCSSLWQDKQVPFHHFAHSLWFHLVC